MPYCEFDWVRPHNATGRIILTRFPGLCSRDEFSIRKLDGTLTALRELGCATLVSLVQDSEFAPYCEKSTFADRITRQGLAWHHLPIADYQIPDRLFLEQWLNVSLLLREELRAGRDVCLHCKGGLGRSGTVATLLLTDFGETSTKAMERVRRARPGAVETLDQEAFIHTYAQS